MAPSLPRWPMRPALLLLAAGICAGLAAGCSYISGSELSTRLDPDGDGVPATEDCDEGDPSIGRITRFRDGDLDGHGAGPPLASCELLPGLADSDDDCDDLSASVFPGADERCNNVDDDCDGFIDEEAVDQREWFPDRDGDGYGTALGGLEGVPSCSQPSAGYVDNRLDCDDNDALVGPERTFYDDSDGDGFGDPASASQGCIALGRVANGLDCDDTNADVHPGAQEVCDGDGADEDCDGLVDDEDEDAVGAGLWFGDRDEDGWGSIDIVASSCHSPLPNSSVPAWVSNELDCDDSTPNIDEPTDCPYLDVAVGVNTGCARQSNGRLRCDGAANGVVNSIPDLAFLQVSVGLQHACGVTVSGELRCWGDGPAMAELVDVDGRFTEVSVELNHTCALDVTGEARCWGEGIRYGFAPTEGDRFIDLDSGPAHACVIRASDLAMLCFGNCSEAGECTAPSGDFQAVAVGRDYSCGLSAGGSGSLGQGLCWGDVPLGALLLADREHLQISGSGRNLCALDTTGTARCFSDSAGIDLTPPSGLQFDQIDVGNRFACGITTDQELRCWPE